MLKLLTNFAVFTLCVHGLIHLMGTVVYTGLGSVEGLPYKTTLADRWNVGVPGITLFGALWGVAGAAFVAAGIGLASNAPWWIAAAAGAALLSLLLSLLDWRVAYMGAAVDVTVLAAVAMAVMLPWRG